MANKRTLKKHIRHICTNAALDVLLALPVEQAAPAVRRLATLQTRTLSRVCVLGGKRHADNKAAYRQLAKDFDTQLREIADSLNKKAVKK